MTATRAMTPPGTFLMTIESDDEVRAYAHEGHVDSPILGMQVDRLDESSDEEQDKEESVAVISKKKQQKKDEKKKQNAAVSDIAEGFEFDDGSAFRVRVCFASATGNSWDFTSMTSFPKAIAHIDNMERRSYGDSVRTTVQKKIEARRKERQDARKEKKKSLQAAEKAATATTTDGAEQATTGDDNDNNKEVAKDDADGDNDSDSDDEDAAAADVVEESKLQEALHERKQNAASAAVDAIEKKKADAFFETEFQAPEMDNTTSFSDLKLSRPLLRAVSSLGFSAPTPIQQRAIPVAMTGKDICASAQTGSGKTAAFLLPILERLQFRSRRVAATRVLIICPVRELATQCQSMLEQLAKFTDITSGLAVGGLPLREQEAELRLCPDVIICTPGRMIDHLRNSRSIHLDELEILVLDEADRLLELGFQEEVQELVKFCPVARQTLLFSATLTSKVDELIKLSMKRPVRISTDPLFDMAQHLVQEFVRIRPTREDDREAILLALCTRTFKTNALQRFRDGTADVLLCTDIAARGIDVEGVHAVINYQMPKDVTTYVHRVGRTARAGRNGRAVTLTSENRRLIMKEVSRHCHGFVKSRSVPDAVIAQWKQRIDNMEADVTSVMKEESMEKRMREAEREASRVTNLVRHKDEIHSRPARTWFLNEKEKKGVVERAEEHRQANLMVHDDKPDKKKVTLNHKKRKTAELRDREQRALEEADNDGKKVFTSDHVAGAAKSAKRKAIEEKRKLGTFE
ncbi:hypothetical protein DYB37_009054 [Aphanomyces astaci]|uniref:RNA helicase n=1 Tax=Aphanomyces astaci TaxID=112090 RepID=A0A3R6XBR4_APHAT|nr:hypothetical protein DYB37_009054 [Aphanomyces astaci]